MVEIRQTSEFKE
jgi:putative addiction module killer protein/probable addiction module antidote protein